MVKSAQRYASLTKLSYKQLANDDAQAKRSPEEEGDYMAFEQLVAEANLKKEKESKKKDKEKKKHRHSSDKGSTHSAQAAATAADAPNVPKASS